MELLSLSFDASPEEVRFGAGLELGTPRDGPWKNTPWIAIKRGQSPTCWRTTHGSWARGLVNYPVFGGD